MRISLLPKKLAAATDFLRGVMQHDIDQFPPEDELTEEQRKKLTDIRLSGKLTPLQEVEFFLRYPHIVGIGLYQLSRIGYKPDVVRKAWELKKKIDKSISFLVDGLPDYIYKDILSNLSRFGIRGKEAINVFTYRVTQGYPPFFIEGLAKAFPEEYRACSGIPNDEKIEALRNFLEAPTHGRYNIISGAIKEEQTRNAKEKTRSDINGIIGNTRRACLDLADDISEMKRRTTESGSRPLYGSGSSVLAEIDELLEDYIEKGIEQRDTSYPMRYFTTHSDAIGHLGLIFLGQTCISKDQLMSLRSMAEKYPEHHFDILTDHSVNEILRDMEKPLDPSPDADTKSLTVTLENPDTYEVESVQSLGEIGSPWTRFSDYGSADSYLGTLNGDAYVDRLTEEELFLKWYEDRKASYGQDQEAFYLDLLKNEVFLDMTKNAGSDLFSMKVQNYIPMSREDYVREFKVYSGFVLPTRIETAKKIWSEIPDHIKDSQDFEMTWFVTLSGVFSRQAVMNKCLQWVSDSMKIVDHIDCRGGATPEMKDEIRRVAQKKKGDARQIFREKLPKFLESPDVQTYTLTDFPDLLAHVISTLEMHTYKDVNEHDYRKMSFERAMQTLDNLQICVIDSSMYIQFFGDQVLKDMDLHPEGKGGFYSPRFSFSSDHATAVIFKKEIVDSGSVEGILTNLLGVPPDAESKLGSLSEERTLWHEVMHATMAAADVSSDEYDAKSVQQWIQQPEEMLAISYGELPYIKNKLHNFFSNILPESERITQGLVSQMKSDLMEIFPLYFQGMTTDEANVLMEEAFKGEDGEASFSDYALSILNSVSRESKIDMLTELFTEFFMRKTMRAHIEHWMETWVEKNPNEALTFKEDEPKVPERYQFRMPTERDPFIRQLEGRTDYQEFFKQVQQKINDLIVHNYDQPPDYLRPYVHKTHPNIVKKPYNIEELIRFIFGPPSTINDVNLSERNQYFGYLVPTSLRNDVEALVLREKERRGALPPYPESRTHTTPDLAEETGKFITEMEDQYGPDWVWVAHRKTWYKVARKDLQDVRR